MGRVVLRSDVANGKLLQVWSDQRHSVQPLSAWENDGMPRRGKPDLPLPAARAPQAAARVEPSARETEMPGGRPRLKSATRRSLMAAVVAVLVVALAVFTWIVPPRAVVLHNILHHLNILPFMLAGLIFGWRGTLRAIALALVLQAPSIYRHWHTEPLDAQDQIVELSTFGLAGVIAGVVADRERAQRHQAERATAELERLHRELQQSVEQLRKSERLSAAGHLAASLAHEIRNPLASISGAAGILARGQAPAASQSECLDILRQESQRLNKLLTNFLDFANPRLPRFQRAEPLSLVQSVTALAQHAAEAMAVRLSFRMELEPGVPGDADEVECDPEQIKQVLLNLLLNAVQASEAGGQVVVRGSQTAALLQIEVCDEGVGVLERDLTHIFDPFFTTKANGTGLGLAVASNIVVQHGGTLDCRPNQPRGMIFRMQLPWRQATGRRAREAAEPVRA